MDRTIAPFVREQVLFFSTSSSHGFEAGNEVVLMLGFVLGRSVRIDGCGVGRGGHGCEVPTIELTTVFQLGVYFTVILLSQIVIILIGSISTS